MSARRGLEEATAIRHRVAWSAAVLPVVLAAAQSGATPPTPPARLVLPEMLAKPQVELSKPVIAVRVEVRQPVFDLVLAVTLQRLRAGAPDFEQPTPAPLLEPSGGRPTRRSSNEASRSRSSSRSPAKPALTSGCGGGPGKQAGFRTASCAT